MRKKKGVIITVTTALAIAACGVGCLYAGMKKTMQENTVTQVVQKPDVILEEGTQVETGHIVNQVNQVWLEEEGIYLPETAEIVSRKGGCYGIVWDDYTIEYYQNDNYFEGETEEDLGLGKLMPILQDTINKYSGQDMGECHVEVYLVGTDKDDMEADENIVTIIPENADEPITEVEAREGEVVRFYQFDSKHYQVGVSFNKYEYFIMVDSVTGEVFGYYYANNNLGGFSNGWEMVESYDPNYELSEEAQKEYDELIASFVTNDLKLGKVEKVYGQEWGLAYIENGNNDVRAYYIALCKTENGTMIDVSVDMGEKMVTSFDTTVIYALEG